MLIMLNMIVKVKYFMNSMPFNGKSMLLLLVVFINNGAILLYMIYIYIYYI